MNRIPLEARPNQSLEVLLNTRRYQITIKETGGVMAISITRDDVILIQNQIIPANAPLIPYRYLEAGNFVVLTENDDLPNYTEFGLSQRLIYVPQTELDSLRG